MVEGESTTFENPAYEPDPWDDDEDDNGDETTPFFFKNGTSMPAFSQYQEEIEMKTMQHEKDWQPDTSYIETSFGVPTSSERAWVAAKDLFPKMSSSELEVSYNTKGRLQVKMWGVGKKPYNLTTTERSTGREQINKSLPKEIKNALCESKYEMQREEWGEKREKYKKQMDEKTQEIEKENQNLKALEESDDPPQSEIEKSRDKIRVLQIEKESSKSAYNFADLKISDAPKSEIEKQQARVRTVDADFTKAHADYNKRYPSDTYESNTGEYFEEVEDDEEPEIFDERQRIKSIIKQNNYLRSHLVTDRYISENPEQVPERREAAKKDWKQIKQLMKETELLERLGIKNPVLEKEREVFQKEKADLDRLIESDKKIIADLNSTAYKREAAEERIVHREREREWISEHLYQTERDLGLEDRRSLQEQNKRYLQKTWRDGNRHLSGRRHYNWGCYWSNHQCFEKTRKRFGKWPLNDWREG